MTMLDDRAIAGLRALVGEPGAGDVLGDRFELREVIGEGGMGAVYSAWDRARDREVAVKVLRASGDDDEARFDRECSSLAALAHPALVPYVARGMQQGIHWMAMERLVGSTLDRRRARCRRHARARPSYRGRARERSSPRRHASRREAVERLPRR